MGRTQSMEERQMRSEIRKNYISEHPEVLTLLSENGKKNKGIKKTAEHIEKLREIGRKVNPAIDPLNSKSLREEWKRNLLLKQPNCQMCGTNEKLEGHHILSWEFYPEYRYSLANGIILCCKCHKKFPDFLAMFWLKNLFRNKKEQPKLLVENPWSEEDKCWDCNK
jgi:5-methylcytosine-specific restriction endonuclease McrA